ncbi:MAG: hypothetical protein GY757_20675, partial [bacterium]|nr:hypothetical protein [bacterium]
MKIDERYVTCPLCRADDYELYYPETVAPEEKGAGYFCCTSHHLGEHGDIVKCRECGMVFNNPQPDPGELLDTYKEVEDPLYLEETKARERT